MYTNGLPLRLKIDLNEHDDHVAESDDDQEAMMDLSDMLTAGASADGLGE